MKQIPSFKMSLTKGTVQSVLRDDPNELFRAARDAERAADYMKERMIEKEREISKDRGAAIVEEWKARYSAPKKDASKEPEQTKVQVEKKATIPRKRKVSLTPKKEQGKARSMGR